MISSASFRRRCVLLLVITFLIPATHGFAQKKKRKGKNNALGTVSTGPADYRSRNFLVHTDLAPDKANELLKRLETMLSLISKYWGQRNRKVIECYVVEDLSKWQTGRIHPNGLLSIRQGAGVTMSITATRGNRSETKAVVFAVSDRGTPQHEAVHAYCAQVFGHTGPVWYSEGMAEMGQYWKKNDSSVNCHEIVLSYLQNTEPKSLNSIVNGEEFTGDTWQNYAWRWALCHLLANNPNYAQRFRPLGLAILTKKNGASFNQTYGLMKKEIVFEYLFFLEHLDLGYRVDLCRFDWKTKFRSIRGARPATASIEAKKGWQPSRLLLKAGREYEYAASGSWKLSKTGNSLSADGDDDGHGKLMGVILQDNGGAYELGKPFEVGSYGSFTPETEGQLWLRCADEWHQLADNSGKLSVKLKLKGEGQPLPKPKALPIRTKTSPGK